VWNRIFSDTLIRGNTRIYGITQLWFMMNSIRFGHRISRFYLFRGVPIKPRVSSQNMPPKQFTRTQLRVTDIHESDDTLQAAASTAKRTTPTVFPAAEIDNDDDDDLYDVLGGQWNRASPINNASGDHCAQVTDEDRLEVATQNLLMLEMLREKQAQWKAEQRFEWERMGANLGTNGCRMGSMGYRTCWSHRMKHRRHKTKQLHDGWPCMVLRQCKRAGQISGCIMLEYQLPRPPIPTRWTQSRQIRDLSSGRLQ